MAQTMDETESMAAKVNELYWSGSRTVDDIIAELGISRTSLYATIEPEPAGLVCADCHERMAFGNRTMRDRGVAVCPRCGRESEPGEAQAAGAAASTGGNGSGASDARDAIAQLRETLGAVSPQRVALIGGGAALGILLGALATGALREGF